MDSWPTPKSKVLQNRKSFCSQCVCVFFQIWNPQDSQNIRQLVFLVLVFCTYKYSNVRPVDLEFVRLRETAFGNLNAFGLSSSVCVCPWTLLHWLHLFSQDWLSYWRFFPLKKAAVCPKSIYFKRQSFLQTKISHEQYAVFLSKNLSMSGDRMGKRPHLGLKSLDTLRKTTMEQDVTSQRRGLKKCRDPNHIISSSPMVCDKFHWC